MRGEGGGFFHLPDVAELQLPAAPANKGSSQEWWEL